MEASSAAVVNLLKYVLFSAGSISTPNASFSVRSMFKEHYWCLLFMYVGVVYVLCTKPARKMTQPFSTFWQLFLSQTSFPLLTLKKKSYFLVLSHERNDITLFNDGKFFHTFIKA